MSYLLPLWLSEDQVDEEDNLGVFWIISTFLFSLDSWYPSYTVVNWLSWIRDSIGSKYESNHMHMFSYKYYIPNNLLLWVEVVALPILLNNFLSLLTSISYDAQTRQNGRRNCIRHVSDTTARASVLCPIFFVFFHFLIRTDSGRNTPIQAVPAPNRPIQAKIQKKKKKKAQYAPFELNNKTLNYLSSQPNSFFNLQLSHSLCSPIPSQLSALHLPSLKDALSHSLRHILTLLFFAWLSVSSSPQVSSSPHLTDPLSTQVSN